MRRDAPPFACFTLAALAVAGCFFHARSADEDRYREEHRPCDPRGPDAPRDPDRELEAYEQQELFGDETELLRDPACSVTPGTEQEDDALKRACLDHVGTKPERAACRHACLVGARVAAAEQLFRTVVDALGRVQPAFETNKARCIPAHSGRDLWTCLGLPALPPRFVIGFEATKTELVRVVVQGDLLPGKLPLAVEAAEGDEGCGYRAWSVHRAR